MKTNIGRIQVRESHYVANSKETYMIKSALTKTRQDYNESYLN